MGSNRQNSSTRPTLTREYEYDHKIRKIIPKEQHRSRYGRAGKWNWCRDGIRHSDGDAERAAKNDDGAIRSSTDDDGVDRGAESRDV